jgi:hypothetical protein
MSDSSTTTPRALEDDYPWLDPVVVLADVLQVLRLKETDPDKARIEDEHMPAAAALLDSFWDRCEEQALPPAPPMHPLARQAMTQLTIELYRRKDAPFGVLNAWSPDDVATFISSDPLRGVFGIALPLKKGFGIAG